MLILSKEDIRSLLSMADAIGVVREMFIAVSMGKVRIPIRTQIQVDNDSVALFMPAFRMDTRSLGIKVVTVFPRNRDRQLPTIHAVVLYCNPQTGAPEAILEGGYLTGLRTGAAGGLAADLLARSDAKRVALIGAGVQGWFQLEAVCAVRPIAQAWIVDVNLQAAEALAARGRTELGIAATVTPNPDQAVAEADIVITATTSHSPVFSGSALRAGAHITAMGAFTPEMRELDDAALRRCNRIVVDSRDAVWAEAGDLIIPRNAGWFSPDRVDAEIGEVAGGSRPGRQSPSEITLFKTVGIAALDLAVAEAVVARARRLGKGTEI